MMRRLHPFIMNEPDQSRVELASWIFDSHFWIEDYPGYFHCLYCNIQHTSTMGITDDAPLCSQNPAVLRLTK